MRIAVLALQGAFIEHENMLRRLGVSCAELRQRRDLTQSFDGLILPGGESTVQGKLLRELDMFDPIKDYIVGGMPVMGTCAGLILLANRIVNDSEAYFGTLPVSVKRNAYGRQLGSFSCSGILEGTGDESEIPLEFIRAPYISDIDNDEVETLVKIGKMPEGENGENVVAVRYRNQIGVAFHPELTEDTRLHTLFIKMI